jgi:hypothetical protein
MSLFPSLLSVQKTNHQKGPSWLNKTEPFSKPLIATKTQHDKLMLINSQK